MARRSSPFVLLAVSVAAGLAPASEAQTPARTTIRYVVTFPAPQTHYVEVEATYPTDGRTGLDLMMPIWTPGSYLAREYARHVEQVRARAEDGRGLALVKTAKNRWHVDVGRARAVILAYRVYSREMSVRTNWVDAGFALLNGAPTFITLADQQARPHEVQLVLPSAWRASVTGLPPAPGGRAHHYLAQDYDTLVDAPIVAGNPHVDEFVVSGKKHYLVTEGDDGIWDRARAAGDAEKIVRAAEALWGSLPYDKYIFFNLLTGPGGGLEHANSTVLMTTRWAASTRQGYLDWLSLASHEFFHAWNVKRLRPIELGPFDYEHEVYTTSLWIAEGFTDYYADLLVHRAGLSTRDEYLGALSNQIRQLQTTPGRLQQTAEEASFDAWIKQYRPHENSDNTTISYYVKGAVIAFLLDARIRAGTGGARSLDDGMRLAQERYAGAQGYTRAQWRQTMQDAADVEIESWLTHATETTDELDYREALSWLGLRLVTPEGKGRAWLGLLTRGEAGRLLVREVPRGTPGYDAGFNVDDEILAIGEHRVTAAQWTERMDAYKPGQAASILIARRDRLMRLEAIFGNEPGAGWRLEVRPDATAEQRAHLAGWLDR